MSLAIRPPPSPISEGGMKNLAAGTSAAPAAVATTAPVRKLSNCLRDMDGLSKAFSIMLIFVIIPIVLLYNLKVINEGKIKNEKC
jgi:hypothetical protein